MAKKRTTDKNITRDLTDQASSTTPVDEGQDAKPQPFDKDGYIALIVAGLDNESDQVPEMNSAVETPSEIDEITAEALAERKLDDKRSTIYVSYSADGRWYFWHQLAYTAGVEVIDRLVFTVDGLESSREGFDYFSIKVCRAWHDATVLADALACIFSDMHINIGEIIWETDDPSLDVDLRAYVGRTIKKVAALLPEAYEEAVRVRQHMDESDALNSLITALGNKLKEEEVALSDTKEKLSAAESKMAAIERELDERRKMSRT